MLIYFDYQLIINTRQKNKCEFKYLFKIRIELKNYINTFKTILKRKLTMKRMTFITKL